MKKLIITVFLLSMVSCSQGYYQLRDKTRGSTEVFNYEYTNDYYVSELRSTHFAVNVLISEPYVVSFPQKEYGSLYESADIEAVSICDVSIRSDGTVERYEIKKSAGLGLDRFTGELLSSMKFKPLSYKGNDYPVKFRIVLHYTK